MCIRDRCYFRTLRISENMSIPTFRQYFVHFPKWIMGNLCTVKKSVSGTLLCTTQLQLVFRFFWDMDVEAITISLWNRRKWTYSYFGTSYRVVPNDIYVPSLYPLDNLFLALLCRWQSSSQTSAFPPWQTFTWLRFEGNDRWLCSKIAITLTSLIPDVRTIGPNCIVM